MKIDLTVLSLHAERHTTNSKKIVSPLRSVFMQAVLKKIGLAWFISAVLLNTSLSAQGPLTFDPRNCGLNCSANDVRVTAAQLYADAAGTTPLTGTCTPGTSIVAYLGVTFTNNSSGPKHVLALAVDIWTNNVNTGTLLYCPALDLAGGASLVYTIPVPITWVCGQAIELRNIFGAWGTGSMDVCPTQCSDFNPAKCGTSPDIVVLTPPTASFTYACATQPNLRTMNFTNTSTGGSSTALSYVWDFGDGSPTVTTVSPSHTFPGNGPYTVSLTVTNSVGTDTETHDVMPGNCCPTTKAGPDGSTTVLYNSTPPKNFFS